MVSRGVRETLDLMGAAAAVAAASLTGLASPAPALSEPAGSVATTAALDACPAVPPGFASCDAHVRSAGGQIPMIGFRHASADGVVGNNGAYDPAYLQSAYNLWSSSLGSAGSGRTVAVVDAYDDPNAESDLNAYRSRFNLPACTTADGCLKKLNESGVSGSYPVADFSWSEETSLDLDMVSAICPDCHILLVEANTDSFGDLGTSVNTAVAAGAVAVSNSYGGSEFYGEDTLSQDYYNHPGVAVVASSGDSGYGVSFPAASPSVVAVGGTTLLQSSDNGLRSATETAWSGAGSGCSSGEAKPSWQKDAGCGDRTVADVSAVANPSTGVWLYDSYQAAGWMIAGGTSVASPIVAAVFALAGASGPSASSSPASWLYANRSGLNDIVSGTNGLCGTYLCGATVGYDGPTGLGTPDGLSSFMPPGSRGVTVPGAPTGLRSSVTGGAVLIGWSPPNSTGGAALSGYTILRGSASGSETPYATVSASTTRYNDSSVTAGATYFYEVAAVNAVGTGQASNEMSVTTPIGSTSGGSTGSSGGGSSGSAPQAPVLTAAPAASHGIGLTWTVPTGAGSAYRLYRTGGGRQVVTAVVCALTLSCSYDDTATVSGVSYTYQIVASNSAGAGTPSNRASAIAS